LYSAREHCRWKIALTNVEFTGGERSGRIEILWGDKPNFHGCVLWLLAASVEQRTSSSSSTAWSVDSLSGLRNARTAAPYLSSAAHDAPVIAKPRREGAKATLLMNSLLETMSDLQKTAVYPFL
jgi:hypothetical protein